MKESKEKMIDLVVKKCIDSEYTPDVWFSSNIFMIFGLPTRKLQGNPTYWNKETSLCKLSIARDEKFEIPYGCYARMNQIFIDTEVKTKNTNIIDVGKSFNEYVKKLGYKEGWANKALLQQLINYVTTVIKVEPKNPTPGHIIGMHSLVARAWDIHFDVKNPEQLMLSRGQIILDERYARWIHGHCVPLNMDIVNVFKRNPLALDFYRYLAYRNNELNKTISFPDYKLFGQLGTEIANDRINRIRLKQILKAIQLYWPVKAKFEDGFFELKPSPSIVRKQISSSTEIRIIDQFEE